MYKRRTLMRKILFRISILVMVAVTSLSFTACSLFQLQNDKKEPTLTESSTTTETVVFNTESTGRELMDKVQAVAMVERSIVAISTDTGRGSGVIVDMAVLDSNNNLTEEEGEFYILTCHHVISSAGNVTVYLPDREGDNYGESDYDENNEFVYEGVIGGKNRNYSVTLVGGDATSDVAILKLTITDSEVAETIVKAKIAPINSEIYSIKKGEDVFAIGNPTGELPGTVSVGTISYINRETTISDVGNMTLLQLNVDIYHGSSGGGLFNMYGELIGITNAGSDTNSGLNYAIPYVIDALNGKADNGFVNIAQHLAGTVTENNYGYVSGRLQKFGFVAQQEIVQTTSGETTIVKAASIESGSKSAVSGLQVGDIISKATINDGTPTTITKLADLTGVITSLKKGDRITLTIERVYFRDYETKTLSPMTAEQLIFCDTGIYA